MGYAFGFRAVKRRCAVDLSSLWLPIDDRQALAILKAKGFRVIEADVVAFARKLIGKARYEFKARYSQAPQVVNCSRLVKWVYARRGIWVPRIAVEQRTVGTPVPPDDLRAGDLVFKTAPRFNYYLDDPADQVGHVGLATGQGTIIHAANALRGVIESDVQAFTRPSVFRGARRIIRDPDRTFTLICPSEREVETSSQLRWIILQSLPRDP